MTRKEWYVALVKAVENNNASSIEMLLSEGKEDKGEFNALGWHSVKTGKNVIHYAVEKGNLIILDMLLKYSPKLLQEKGKFEKTATEYGEGLLEESHNSNIFDCVTHLRHLEEMQKRQEITARQIERTDIELASETHEMAEDSTRDFIKQYVQVARERIGDKVRYYVHFGEPLKRPKTEHGRGQVHHISAYVLVTNAITKQMDGKDPEQVGPVLERMVRMYAPGSVSEFKLKRSEYEEIGVLSKEGRDTVTLADRRTKQFLKNLALQKEELPDALRQEFDRVLILSSDKQQTLQTNEHKNLLKGGALLEKHTALVELITFVVCSVNIEHGVTYGDGSKSQGGAERWAVDRLRKGEKPAQNAQKLFDYSEALFKNNDADHYREKIVTHLSLIKDAFPDIKVDIPFLKDFFRLDGAEALKDSELKQVIGEVNAFRKEAEKAVSGSRESTSSSQTRARVRATNSTNVAPAVNAPNNNGSKKTRD